MLTFAHLRRRLPRAASPAGALVPALLVALATGSGCQTYQPDPFDPFEALRALERARPKRPPAPSARPAAGFDLKDGLSAREAAAIAVHQNPALRARRATIGVAKAELVQAGLLADVQIGWNAFDQTADLLTEGQATTGSYITGASLSWTLPRPGELDAKEAAAQAEVERARQQALQAELQLVREVYRALLAVRAAEASLALNARLRDVAERTSLFFERARLAGAATALDANLARTAFVSVTLSRVELETDLREGWLALNAALGLPPGTTWKLQADDDLLAPPTGTSPTAKQLVRVALRRRPDLRALEARYRRAEEELRLEVIRQWPELSIGTGIGLVLPILSGWNRPAIRTATRRRALIRRQLDAAVHRLRAEVYAAALARDRRRLRLERLETELRPRLRQTLALSDAAFRAKAVTLVQSLTAQGQVNAARVGILDARIQYAEARIDLRATTGTLLPSVAPNDAPKKKTPPKTKKETTR